MDGTEAGRALALRRRRVAKACASCGGAFESYPRARYCSTRCRVRAYDRRMAREKSSQKGGVGG